MSRNKTRKISLLSTMPPTADTNWRHRECPTLSLSDSLRKMPVNYDGVKKMLAAAGFEKFFKQGQKRSWAELKSKFPNLNWLMICGQEDATWDDKFFLLIKAFFSYPAGDLVARIYTEPEDPKNMAFIHFGDETGELTVGVIYNFDELRLLEVKELTDRKTELEAKKEDL